MRTTAACQPCLMRLALRTARQITDDARLLGEVEREVAAALATMDFDAPPPLLARPLFELVCRATGDADPLRALRRRDNERARRLVPGLRARIRRADDPLATALCISAAANAIDFAAQSELGPAEIERALAPERAAARGRDVALLRQALAGADDVLFLADNAGEIVLDALLLEQLPAPRIAVAVRGGPSMNDALREDAVAARLPTRCEIVDSGSAVSGTVLGDCSEPFRARFRAAGLVIAKGQGNYETLSPSTANLLFVLKVKCPTVAEHLQRPVGSLAVHWQAAAR